MKAADKLSALRIILAPVFFIIYFIPQWNPAGIAERFPGMSVWSVPVLWLIFAASAFSDMFDGMVARRRNEVSDFGKLFDPFTDTLAQLTYFLCFVLDGFFPALLYIVILYREFGILFLRNLMLKKGTAMGARVSGKIKTVAYISACALALLALGIRRTKFAGGFEALASTAALAVFVVSAALAVFSFVDYLSVYRREK
ncbi:MAG: CDP-diacylglycerol--glycerol-3-phosphate 3-phosphatidyltransferase [Treponema sp.]|nr:CDP-diacylglycerol--glycerol-3-phosphate 3-phosphatidyltransferase [Treponema sp.]